METTSPGLPEELFVELDTVVQRLDTPGRPKRECPAVLGRRPQPLQHLYWISRRFTTAMGWGLTSEGGHPSDSLLAVDLPLIGDRACRRTLGGKYVASVMLCAGAKGGDTCLGDSGGPLMVPGGYLGWKLVGVTSFGEGCARPGQPGVYAWIAGKKLRAWLTAQA